MTDRAVVLAAVGDISFRGEPGEATLERGAAYPFAPIRPWLAEADLRFANMESVFVPEAYPDEELSSKALAGPTATAPALAEAGFDVLNMASNHVLDCGTEGLEHTTRVIQDLGIKTFGAGLDAETAHRPVIVECNGLRVGFLGYQEDCNYTYGHVGAGPAYLAERDILRDMAGLRGKVDVLVVSLHADLEFMETPAVWRRDLSRRLARAGADLILEHHPHVPQGVERAGRSLIAYSLGNCLFDAHTSKYMVANGPHTAHSFVLRVRLSAEGAGEFERLPFSICPPPGQRPVPMEGEELSAGLRYLEYLDAQLADEAAVQANWRRRCMGMLGTYLKRAADMSPEAFMERWAWVLTCVQENRSWTSEILRMAEERFRSEAAAEKPFLRRHRPSFRFESQEKEKDEESKKADG
jgi:poly-gamma-glutamate synthesis protein (capsule biosynthesis protein)